jgi:hypothetical protein
MCNTLKLFVSVQHEKEFHPEDVSEDLDLSCTDTDPAFLLYRRSKIPRTKKHKVLKHILKRKEECQMHVDGDEEFQNNKMDEVNDTMKTKRNIPRH